MHHCIWGAQYAGAYPVAVLTPVLQKDEIQRHYLDPYGVPKDKVMGLSLDPEPGKKKPSVSFMNRYVAESLAPVFQQQGIRFLVIGDAEYFKVITGKQKVETMLGYVVDVKPEYGPLKAVYVPNYRQVFYDPAKIGDKIGRGMKALMAYANGTYQPPGCDIIKTEAYPESEQDIKDWLRKILDGGCDLTLDIEGFSLKSTECGVATVTICWNQNEGIAFAIDYEPIPGATAAPYGRYVPHAAKRRLLMDFLIACHIKGRKIIFHNIAFDASVIIYTLFMANILDTDGLLYGLEVMLSLFDCTQIMTYLATNSCAGNKLSLKEQGQAFAGDWAEAEIHDITLIPLPQLLRYNLIDGLTTWYVHNKYDPVIDQDQQREVYEGVFKNALVDIVQMQLTGMPLNMAKVKKARVTLQADEDDAVRRILANPKVKEFEYLLTEKHVEKRNAALKNKRITMEDEPQAFNPNSDPQIQDLLYEFLGLPVIEKTKSKAPATGNKVLTNLKNRTEDPVILELLDALLDFKAVNKILTSFIPAMEGAVRGPDGWHYLLGYFKLGGTVSGRLASANPNLQNLPANSRYAKVIKECFEAPPGWMFCGLDFASLEDRISALTTKDPNKLKVYTMGYDGHAMRAVAYFPEAMPDIDPNDVAAVNAIAEKGHRYGPYRQESKAPTFALTYQGTYLTLMKNCGFSKPKALQVENNYRILYKVSIDWVRAKLNQAAIDGYITAAFGLRVRTPLLHQTVLGTSKTPYEAEAEGRTAGNALGQSWCLLNSRAGSEFMQKVRKSEFRLDIRPCAQIHDAQYFLVREDMRPLLYMNEHLVKAVNWNDHPDIYHPEVGLGGEVGIFFPNWGNEITLANDVTTPEQVHAAIRANLKKLAEKAKK